MYAERKCTPEDCMRNVCGMHAEHVFTRPKKQAHWGPKGPDSAQTPWSPGGAAGKLIFRSKYNKMYALMPSLDIFWRRLEVDMLLYV